MDLYGLQTSDFFRIDDLLDFTNDELFSSTTTDSGNLPPPEIASGNRSLAASGNRDQPNTFHSADFTDDLCVPSDDVAELEWLSNFVDDSFADFPENELAGTVMARPDSSFPGRTRSKRSRASSTNKVWTSSSSSSVISGERSSSSSPASSPTGARKCTHCASEKTPQWRTGPLGPKTLCNACGVRYKSGRLVPEYRPAASPTFVLTQHSNSHRKVMELRRQKEILRQQQQQQQLYHHHHDFEEVSLNFLFFALML
ncbi:unnamed protein product, partial [Vitis vinifera]